MNNWSGQLVYWGGYEHTGVQPLEGYDNQGVVTIENKYNFPGYYDMYSSVKGNVANLVAPNIRAGVRVGRADGYGADDTNSILGTFTAEHNLYPQYVIQGAWGWANGQRVDGTIPQWGYQYLVPTTYDYVGLPAGGYAQSEQVIAGSGNLTAGNIRSGVNIFNVVGNLAPLQSGGIGVYRYDTPLGTSSGESAAIASPSPGNIIGILLKLNVSGTIYYSCYLPCLDIYSSCSGQAFVYQGSGFSSRYYGFNDNFSGVSIAHTANIYSTSALVPSAVQFCSPISSISVENDGGAYAGTILPYSGGHVIPSQYYTITRGVYSFTNIQSATINIYKYYSWCVDYIQSLIIFTR